MRENKLFEALLDVIPFASYAADIDTYEVVYANKMMYEKMYAPREKACWKKIYGQEDVCSWCTISKFKQREKLYNSGKIESTFFDEATDKWFQVYDEIVRWPDGKTVKYTIAVDITEQKEIQASFIKTHTKLALQTRKLKSTYEKMEILATKDFLTGINNRGNFFTLGEKLWETELEEGLNIYVAMLDIDKFKSLNDNYGHKIGDKALLEFTKSVSIHLAKDDIFGRIGGEEFALIIVALCSDDVENRLETIRKDVASIVIENEQQEKIQFTVSIGLFEKENNIPLDKALECADEKLYEAKESGRNKIIFRNGTDGRK